MGNWYAAPTGRTDGDGSITAPWDLITAFNQKALIKPGDTLYLRGGAYRQPEAWAWTPKFLGTAAAPIVVRSFPKERAMLDIGSYNAHVIFNNPLFPQNGNADQCEYVELWDIEFFISDPVRTSPYKDNVGDQGSLQCHGRGLKFIHCAIVGIGNFQVSEYATDFVAYGCMLGEMGWVGPDRGHGHCCYIQNGVDGIKLVENCFIYWSFDVLFQAYGTRAQTKNIHVVKNIFFNGGAPLSVNAIQFMVGQNAPTGIEVSGNVWFVSPQLPGGVVQTGWQWDVQNGICVVQDNLTIGPVFEVGNWDKATVQRNTVFSRGVDATVAYNLYTPAVPPQSFKNWQIDNNTYGPGILKSGTRHVDFATGGAVSDGITGYTDATAWKASIGGGDTHSTFNAVPQLEIRVEPSRYIPGRVHIAVYNPAKLPSITIDGAACGLKLGDAYEIRDPQKRLAAIASGVYSGGGITLPVTGLTCAPIYGWSQVPAHTAPEFVPLVLSFGQSLDGTWVAQPGVPLPPPVPIPDPIPIPPGANTMVISSFKASAAAIANGGSVTLSWAATKDAGSTEGLVLSCDDGSSYGAQPLVKTTGPLVTTAKDKVVTYSLAPMGGTPAVPTGTPATVRVTVGTPAGGPPPQPAVWSATGAIPQGLIMSTNGVLSGTPTVAGDYTFEVKCMEPSKPDAIMTAKLTVNTPAPPNPNPAPVVVTLPPATAGQPYSYQFVG